MALQKPPNYNIVTQEVYITTKARHRFVVQLASNDARVLCELFAQISFVVVIALDDSPHIQQSSSNVDCTACRGLSIEDAFIGRNFHE